MRESTKMRCTIAADSAVRGAFAHMLPKATQFAAWRLRGNATEGHALNIGEPATLKEAVEAALLFLDHKDMLIVRENNSAKRAAWQHAYTVKRDSTPRYRRVAGGTLERWHRLYEAHLFTMAVDAFESTRPFDALADDPTGVDATLLGNALGVQDV